MTDMMIPGVLVVEAARIFDAEAASIVGGFARHAYRWAVLSNDPAWPNPAWPTSDSLMRQIEDFNPAIVHFALHGTERGLVFRLEDEPEGMVTLTWPEIESMPHWEGRVVITGACGMLRHSEAFLRAGAVAVVAPWVRIEWGHLCHFFRIFYSSLLNGCSLADALKSTRDYMAEHYLEHECMDMEGNGDWRVQGPEPPNPRLPPDSQRATRVVYR